MGHYDEFYEAEYAKKRSAERDMYKRAHEKLIELQRILTHKSEYIDYHIDMIDALIQREIR